MSRKIIFAFLLFIVTLKEVFSTHDDTKCDQQLKAFSEAFQQQEPWALELFDSWGKINSGYFEGNLISYGSFNLCLNFTKSLKDEDSIDGQYCLVKFEISGMRIEDFVVGIEVRKDSAISNAVCVPETCSPEKVLTFVNSFMNQVNFSAVEAKCQTKHSLPFDSADKIALIVSIIFGTLMLACTVIDLIIRRTSKKNPQKLLIAFSVYTNGKNLFKINREESEESIDCLEGLSCIALIGVIFGYRYNHEMTSPKSYLPEVVDRLNHSWNVLLIWPEFSVDTFLLIGGVLCAMNLLREFEKKKFNFLKKILQRFISYTPLFGATILIGNAILRHVKSPIDDPENISNCYDFWWSSLLHIQNYVNPEKLCVFNSWYLSVDFQLFLISPILIYPAFKLGWKYLWTLPVLAMASSIYLTILNCNEKFDANDLSKMIVPTHARVAPWLIGIVLGYTFHKLRDQEIKWNKFLVGFFWINSLNSLAFSVYCLSLLNRLENNDLELWQSSIIKGFMRMTWSLAISWIIFACYKLKSGGPIRWFLSLPEWQPLAKVSLSMYLVGSIYQRWSMMITMQPSTAGVFPIFNLFLSDFLGTLIIGIVFTLGFQTPLMIIHDYLSNRYQTKTYKLSNTK